VGERGDALWELAATLTGANGTDAVAVRGLALEGLFRGGAVLLGLTAGAAAASAAEPETHRTGWRRK
jgi:hypothetical protein